jgi:DNA-binding phage protein
LSNTKEVAAYLDAVMELDDKEALLVSLRQIAKASGSAEIKTLAEVASPTLETMNRILHSVGLRLGVAVAR